MKHISFILLFMMVLPLAAEKKVFGWIEYAFIGKGEYRMKAKLDSGAKTSAIHSQEVEVFKTEAGKEKVRFKIKGSRKEGSKRYWKTVVMTKDVHRTVQVKSSNGDVSARISVLLPVRVGSSILESEFTLTDREDMNYPILLGRNAIAELGLVDCSESFLMKN